MPAPMSVTGLASIPAQRSAAINAGLTFAVPRNLSALSAAGCAQLIAERLAELQSAAEALSMPKVGAALRAVEARFAVL